MKRLYPSFLASACLVSLTACAPAQQSQNGIVYLHDLVANYSSADAALKSLLAKNQNVIVDFFATWCGPCKNLSATLSKMASELTDVLVIKIDGDKFGALLNAYGVRSYPTLFFYKDGKQVHKHVGNPTPSALRSLITTYLR